MEEQKLLEILKILENDEDNIEIVSKIKACIQKGDYQSALSILQTLKNNEVVKVDEIPHNETNEIFLNLDNINEFTKSQTKRIQKQITPSKNEQDELKPIYADKKEDDNEFPFDFKLEDFQEDDEENDTELNLIFEEEQEDEFKYPEELEDHKLEETYVGLIISNPKNLALYSIPIEQNYFESNRLNQLYKLMIFGDGHKYCPEKSKRGYNFTKENERIINHKQELKEKYQNRKIDIKKVYLDLLKLFTLRKYYLKNPIENIQEEILKIKNYSLYNKMNIEEVVASIDQVITTQKFKQSILNNNSFEFLISNDNNLTSGLDLPFPILSENFKGIRKGETMSIAMPSNAGKSRITILLCAYIALIYKKKVLLISNEMSEDKMKLCLLTTIINNSEIQKEHGINTTISESELLDFKFRPNNGANCEVDEKGYVKKRPGEKQYDFANRLFEISDQFKSVVKIVKWFENETKNQIYFINIIDHTAEELKKVITNYYYKDHIEYIFYDTMKADTANIGVEEEVKKTATILSNLAQEFEIFIGSTLQIAETRTLPINLSITDLSSCKTVKEVLDILILFKQIMPQDYKKYEYTKTPNSHEAFELELSSDINDRYYACVVDKNRAGAKPKVLFKLNLAYNYWEELGYLRLKPDYEDV